MSELAKTRHTLIFDIEFLRNEAIAVTQPWQRSRMITEQIFTNAGFARATGRFCRNISTMDALAQIDYATVLIPGKAALSCLAKRRDVVDLEEPYDVPFSFYVAVERDGYTSKATLRLFRLFAWNLSYILILR